jgi:hypothetical protein
MCIYMSKMVLVTSPFCSGSGFLAQAQASYVPSVLHAASIFLARHFFCLWLAVLLVRGA